jgi:hypothetical protein
MTRDVAHLRNCDEIGELLELASKEQDQDTVGALFEEILRHLEDKQRSLTTPPLAASRTTQRRQTLM